MKSAVAAVVMVVVAACGGAAGVDGGGTTGPRAIAPDAGVAAGSGGTGTGSSPASEPLTIRECDDLIAHAVTLAAAARGSAAATPAETEAVTAGLGTDFGERCAALPRAQYRCALAATTIAVFAACEP